MADAFLTVFCSCPSKAVAQQLAEALVAQRLAACVQIIDGISSVYRWQDKVTTDTEALLLIKTTAQHFETITLQIETQHPYDLPEIVALPLTHLSPRYAQWLHTHTQPLEE